MRWWIAIVVACCALSAQALAQDALAQDKEKPAAPESAEAGTPEASAAETAQQPRARRHRHAHGHHHHHGHSHAGHAHSHGKPKARPRKRAQAEPHTHAQRNGEPHAHGEAGHRHHGIETEHLFGFTTGSDIDAPGAKHAIADLTGRFARAGGAYAAASQRFEYAFTPWRDFHVGLNASLAAHAIAGVPGLDDRRSAAFEGVGIELRQRLLDRAHAPFGLTIIAEPHVARIDEVSGERAQKFAVEFTVAADRELIKDTLFGAINLTYEPEWVRLAATGEQERESTIGASLALMAKVMPSVFVGGEVRYLRAYEGVALDRFAGEALFAGPSLFVNVNNRLSLIAAWSTQIAGRPAGMDTALDLENFERHRVKLKAVVSF